MTRKAPTLRLLLCAPLACLLTAILSGCGIAPVAYSPKQAQPLTGHLAENTALQGIDTLSLQGRYGPEDIIMAPDGSLVCGSHAGPTDFSDGQILKVWPKSGQVEVLYEASGMVAGLHYAPNGELLALSHRQGLIALDARGHARVLASEDGQGRPFRIPNGLEVARNGMVYFTNTSEAAPYTIPYGRQMILEQKPLGGLYAYNPTTQKVQTLIDGLYFGNGVVLSKAEDYLLVVETTRYRVLRHWLAGPMAGNTEVFIDNLPGFPNGISIRPNGSYWLGFTTRRNAALDGIHPSPLLKRLFWALPEAMQPQQEAYGMVLNISEQGEILQAFYDPTGQWLPEAGAVKEHNGKLYIGGDVLPYIGVYPLPAETLAQE